VAMLILHIGLHKTGSTSIQHALVEHAECLERASVRYARSGRSRRAHHPLWGELAKTPAPPGGHWRDLLEELARYPRHRLVVSSENFSTLRPPQIGAVRDLVAAHEVQIAAYLRHPARLLPSTFAQAVKTGAFTGSFSAFFDAHAKRLSSTPARLLRWADVFGYKALRVRYVDQVDDVTADFWRWVAGPGAPLIGTERKNISAGWRALEITRAVVAAVAAQQGVTLQPAQAKRIAADVGLAFQRCGLQQGAAPALTSPQADMLAAAHVEHYGQLCTAGVDMPELPPNPSSNRNGRGDGLYLDATAAAAVAAVLESVWREPRPRRFRLSPQERSAALAAITRLHSGERLET
jgi:hypothetical protein